MTDAARREPTIAAHVRGAGLPPLPRTAWLAVHLDRLAANLALLRGLVPAGTRVEPVVKADAYGHGAVPVARALEAAGADGLGVATLDEALELRAGGVRGPILVLYPIPPSLAPAAAAAGVAVTLGDAVLAERTLEVLDASGTAGPPLEVQIEIETGLGRGGLEPGAAIELAERLRRLGPSARLSLAGVWSHLGSPGDAERSGRQRAAFEAAWSALTARGATEAAGDGRLGAERRHLAASGGLLARSVPPWEGVRVGLALYGVVPDGLALDGDNAAAASGLRPVMELRANPVRVAELPPGTAISYGERFVTRRASRIATLPVGYGDGYQRARTGAAEVLVRGQRAPVVGAIAMDALMVDVTDVAHAGDPAGPVSVDDEFVLLGEQGGEAITALELARLGTTISWEVLAGMARRLPRVYYAGAVPLGLRTLTEERGWWTGPERRQAPG